MACTVAPAVSVFVLPADKVRIPPPPGGFSAEDRYQRGHYLEVQRFLESLPPADLEESAVNMALYGKVLLARGDFESAWRALERARTLEPRAARRGEIEWTLSQGAILWNDFRTAFETTRGQFPVPIVLGLHLLKEFTNEIDYEGRKIRWTRQDFRVPKRSPDQNLFFRGGRVFARGSIDRNGFYQFLVDTGSEPTLMTTAGLTRAGLPPSNKVFPKTVYGLGKTQVEWGRVGDVTIGIAGYGARFLDLAVKEDDSAFEDGIVGTSLLQHFRVRVDFAGWS